MKRSAPLKRSAFKRTKARPNPAGHDPAHLACIRRLPCCVCGTRRRVDPHHSTAGRAFSRKASDHATMPLCRRHHDEFHGARGHFEGWDRAKRRQWQREMVARYAPRTEAA